MRGRPPRGCDASLSSTPVVQLTLVGSPAVGSGGAPWWLSIVTALIAGGFALLGVRWTQRHAAEQRRLDRLEERRREQREALVEVLATGREFVTSLEGVILRASVATDDVAFANSPAVDQHGPLLKAHRRALL